MTAKQEVLDLVTRLSDDSSWDEIEYQLYVRRTVLQRLEEADQGGLIPMEAVEEHFARRCRTR